MIEIVKDSILRGLRVPVREVRLTDQDLEQASIRERSHRTDAAVTGDDLAVDLEPLTDIAIVPHLGPDFARRLVDVDVHDDGSIVRSCRRSRCEGEQYNRGERSH